MFEGVSTTVIILILITLLLLLIFITLGAVAVYSGLFIIPEVGAGKPPIGKIVFAYKFSKGPYKECGQLFTETVIIAPDKKTLGIFYDDPQKVEPSKLRYVVGAIISQDSEPIDEGLVKKFSGEGFKIITLPEVDHVVKTTFPYITSLSIILGVYKVYPRMRDYVEEKKLCAYPYLEYCDGQATHYFAPLSKQEDFYVPECEEERTEEQMSSDFNETLDSTQSTLADSQQDTTVESTDEVTPSAEEETSQEGVAKHLESKQTSFNVTDGKCDEPVSEKTPSDLTDETNGNSDADVEDNSSSSSFEVLKNENAEL